MRHLASARHWLVIVLHHRIIEMRLCAMARVVSVRSLSSMRRRVSADPEDIGG